MSIKQLFCRHEYRLIKANQPVHCPDWEPLKYVQTYRCKKCGDIEDIYCDKPTDFIRVINEKIKEYENTGAINTDDIFDGCHTFGELYDHRAKLFSIVCDVYYEDAWKSKFHADGTMFDGYFIVGINTPKGQASYHYEMMYWDLFNVRELDKAPTWDNHTPKDAINRLLSLKQKVR